MGTGLVLRQARIVRPVDRGKDRIASLRNAPTLANRFHRHAHGIGGLVTRNAGARIRSDRLEERMSRRVNRARDVQHAQPANRVFEHHLARQRLATPGYDPRGVRSQRRLRLRVEPQSHEKTGAREREQENSRSRRSHEHSVWAAERLERELCTRRGRSREQEPYCDFRMVVERRLQPARWQRRGG